MDQKYAPYAQIESFYKYVYERRKADYNFSQNQQEINDALNKAFPTETISALRDELKSANLTVYEAANNVYQSYVDQVGKTN